MLYQMQFAPTSQGTSRMYKALILPVKYLIWNQRGQLKIKFFEWLSYIASYNSILLDTLKKVLFHVIITDHKFLYCNSQLDIKEDLCPWDLFSRLPEQAKQIVGYITQWHIVHRKSMDYIRHYVMRPTKCTSRVIAKTKGQYQSHIFELILRFKISDWDYNPQENSLVSVVWQFYYHLINLAVIPLICFGMQT